MDVKSSFAGMGLADVLGRGLARREQEEAVAQAQEQQELGATQEAPEQPANAMLDPNGGFAQWLASRNTNLQDVMGLMSIERQREYVDPYLKERWRVHNLPQAVSAGLTGKALKQAEEDYYRNGRAMALADFSDRQAEVGTMEKIGSLANSAGQGLVGLVDSVSGLGKAVGGKDNAISGALDTGVKVARDALRGLNNEEEQEITDYFHKLANNNEWGKMAQLVVDYPSLGLGQIAEQIAPLGVWGKALKAAGRGTNALAKATEVERLANVGKGLAKGSSTATITSYSGVQGAGGVAQEMASAGIDPNSPGAMLNVALVGLGSAAIAKLTPATLEKTALQNFMGRGVSEETAKVLAKESVEALKGMGIVKTPLRYGLGLTKNAIKGGAGEGLEESLQSALEGAGIALTNPDGSARDISDVTPEEWDRVAKRGATGGLMGFGLGGAARGAANALSIYGDTAKSQMVRDNDRYWQAAENEGKYIAPENARGKNAEELRRVAEENAKRIEEEKASAKASAEIDTALKEKYGDFGTTARSDYESALKAQPIVENLNDIVERVSKARQAVDPTFEPDVFKQSLTTVTNPNERVDLVRQEADKLGDAVLLGEIDGLRKTLQPDYEFTEDGRYINKSFTNTDDVVKTAIESFTGRPVENVDESLATIRATKPELANVVDKYLQAKADGYTNTAKEIADKFESEVNRAMRKGSKNKTAPTIPVEKIRPNSAALVDIAGALLGKRQAIKYATDLFKDPIKSVESLTNSLHANIGRMGLSEAQQNTLLTSLSELEQAWKNGNYDHQMPTFDKAIADALNAVK